MYGPRGGKRSGRAEPGRPHIHVELQPEHEEPEPASLRTRAQAFDVELRASYMPDCCISAFTFQLLSRCGG